MSKAAIVNKGFESKVKTMARISKESIERMKELIEIGREKGKVLHFSKAFEKYPVEDEVHEGKIEYWKQGENNNEV